MSSYDQTGAFLEENLQEKINTRLTKNALCKIEDQYDLIPYGKSYKPFIIIQDVPSKGRSSRPLGIKTGKQHEFLSDLERNYFLMLEFCDHVIDIREQFPLELRETLLISEELGIAHPIHPGTKEPITMTSDFCITIKPG